MYFLFVGNLKAESPAIHQLVQMNGTRLYAKNHLLNVRIVSIESLFH